jgi:hypothetical protein
MTSKKVNPKLERAIFEELYNAENKNCHLG